MTTSFKKKTTTRGRPPLPPGVKPSITNNNQLLISSGCPSLDTLLGGGLAVGTLLLLEEDTHQSYTNILRKLFIGEGVVCEHVLFIADNVQRPEDLLKEIPRDANEVKSTDPTSSVNPKSSDGGANDLQIAWRYQNLGKVESRIAAPHSQFGHYFDLSETISEDKINILNYSCFSPRSQNLTTGGKGGIKPAYKNLLESIKEAIEKNNLYTENSKEVPSVMRVHIASLGSPLWREKLISSDEYDPSLAWFLTALRSLLRHSYSVCVVSVPTHLFEETFYVKRLEHCCDVVLHLESFAGSEKSQNPLYKEHHGLFHVKKVPHLNSICGHSIDTSDLAFKVKKKKFLIEKLHLPPDISETVSRSSALKPGVPLCSSTTPVNNLLDF